MREGWRKVKFRTLIEEKTTFPLKKGEEYSFIPMENVLSGKRSPVKLETKRFTGSSSRFKNGDTLFARITPCLQNRKIAYVHNLKKGIGFGSTEFFIFRSESNISNDKYLYYLSNLEIFRKNAEKSMVGASGRQRAIFEEVLNFEVTVPDLTTQTQIASIISTYDDLIENNEKRIKVLEEMAQRLYTQWFVKFKFPGYEKVKMVDSGTEYGIVPDGWQIKKIEEVIIRVSAGKRYEKKEIQPVGKIPILDQGKSGTIGFHNNSPDVMASIDDPVIVFANHTCYQRLIIFNFSSIQNVLPYKPKEADIFWMHWATKSTISISDYKGHWPVFISKQILIPEIELTKRFGYKVKTIVLEISYLESYNKLLMEMRDLYIDNLITGKRLIK